MSIDEDDWEERQYFEERERREYERQMERHYSEQYEEYCERMASDCVESEYIKNRADTTRETCILEFEKDWDGPSGRFQWVQSLRDGNPGWKRVNERAKDE